MWYSDLFRTKKHTRPVQELRVLPIGFVEMLESIITVDHRDGHGRESVNITTHRDDILSCALAGVMREALQTILRLRVTFED